MKRIIITLPIGGIPFPVRNADGRQLFKRAMGSSQMLFGRFGGLHQETEDRKSKPKSAFGRQKIRFQPRMAVSGSVRQ
jgi:hypothetical protein